MNKQHRSVENKNASYILETENSRKWKADFTQSSYLHNFNRSSATAQDPGFRREEPLKRSKEVLEMGFPQNSPPATGVNVPKNT